MLKNKRMLIVLGIVIVFILFIPNISKAANAKINVSSTGEVNKPITITVSGTGVQWNLTLKVDGKTIATNRELENYEGNKNISFSGTYTPTSVGNKEVTLEGTVTEYSDGSTVRSFNSKEISVKEADTNSNNNSNNNNNNSNNNNANNNNSNNNSNNSEQTKATLTKLVVAGKTYKNPAKSITVKVDNDVTSAKIVPTTSNGESYTIDKGNTVKLEEGTNTVKITLSSGNVYTVYIRRAAAEDDTPNIIDEEQKDEKVTLKSLLVKGVKSDDEKIELSYTPEFSAEVYEYKMLLDETLSDITKLDIEAVASKGDFTVEISGNEELKDGENIVTITVKSKDGNITATYKIIVTKEAKVMPISATTVEIEQEVVSPRWNTTQKILITLFTSIIAMMGIMYAVIEYRYTNSKEENGEDIERYSFGKIGLKKEEKKEKESDKELEETDEITFEKIDPDKAFQEDEEKVFEKIEHENDDKMSQEGTNLEFETIEEDKPRKNKGKHF